MLVLLVPDAGTAGSRLWYCWFWMLVLLVPDAGPAGSRLWY